MIIHTKHNICSSELTALTTPTLKYICTMTREEVLLAHRVAHSHDMVEIVYIPEGQGTFIIDGKEYDIAAGDLVVYNSGVIHDEANMSVTTADLCMGVSNVCIPQLPPNHILDDRYNPVLHCQDISDFLYTMFTQMYKFMETPSLQNEIICNDMMLSILSIVRQRQAPRSDQTDLETDSRAKDICRSVKEFVNKNYQEELSIDIISRAVSVSPFHMSRVFKEEAGCSPMQYVTRLRLGKAQVLLIHTDMSVTDIACQIGYNNSSAFNYSFQKQFGMTPLAFRNFYLD